MAKKRTVKKTRASRKASRPKKGGRKKAAKKAGKKAAIRRRTGKSEPRQDMVVTLSGDRPAHEVTKDLKARGFKVGRSLGAIGTVITGSAHPHKKQQLEAVPGVADVSDDKPVGIAPPDADVQ